MTLVFFSCLVKFLIIRFELEINIEHHYHTHCMVSNVDVYMWKICDSSVFAIKTVVLNFFLVSPNCKIDTAA